MNQTQNAYDNVEFIDKISKYQRTNDNDLILKSKIPSIVNGGKVIDFGCGDGWFCREAIKRGANSVIGIDISKNSIDINNLENKDSKIKYLVKDLETFKTLNNNNNSSINNNNNDDDSQLINDSFDFAFSAYVTHYLSDLESFFNKVYKLLKSNNGSSFLFSTEHPMRTSTKCIENKFIDHKFEGDEIVKKVWPIANYNEQGRRVFNWLDYKGIVKYHYTIETYINTLIKVGFKIDYLGEIEFSTSEFKFNKSEPQFTEKDRPYALFIKVSK
ncbi:hypothetical protein RB653_003415 [Dictyostelium firmibasis]|uniref:Methyltransferase type 11 domain-containing protein n=1 Tax=Dictyostelium firmibasis TaxID=79012 RepID=A0AAN7YVR7_9MYCE